MRYLLKKIDKYMHLEICSLKKELSVSTFEVLENNLITFKLCVCTCICRNNYSIDAKKI